MGLPRARAALAILPSALWIAGYAPSLGGDLLHFDDRRYVAESLRLGEGSALDALAEAFTRPVFANYHPLHVLSYRLDAIVFGESAWGYRLMNLLYGALAILLLVFLLRRWTGDDEAALWGALLFAVHPIHAESVAWVSARKDVLCLLFGLAAACAYARYSAGGPRRWAWYAGGLLAFAAALLSKSIAATLPVLFLLHDLLVAKRRTLLAVVDKLPWLALSAACLVAAWWAQSTEGALVPMGSDLEGSIATLAAALGQYLRLLVLPWPLSPLYGANPLVSLSEPEAQLALVAIAVPLVLAAWRLVRGRDGWPLFGLLSFFVALAPVCNPFVTVSTLVADRYLLWPSIGVLGLVGVSIARGVRVLERRHWPAGGAVIRGIACGVTAALLGLTLVRAAAWRSDLHLWRDAARHFPRNADVQANLGAALADAGRYAEAARAFQQALAARPGFGKARRNLLRVEARLRSRGDTLGARWVRSLVAAATPVSPK